MHALIFLVVVKRGGVGETKDFILDCLSEIYVCV